MDFWMDEQVAAGDTKNRGEHRNGHWDAMEVVKIRASKKCRYGVLSARTK
jgi:hypothetical protein